MVLKIMFFAANYVLAKTVETKGKRSTSNFWKRSSFQEKPKLDFGKLET